MARQPELDREECLEVLKPRRRGLFGVLPEDTVSRPITALVPKSREDLVDQGNGQGGGLDERLLRSVERLLAGRG